MGIDVPQLHGAPPSRELNGRDYREISRKSTIRYGGLCAADPPQAHRTCGLAAHERAFALDVTYQIGQHLHFLGVKFGQWRAHGSGRTPH